VRFLTGYRPDEIDETYLKELAQTADTLVLYMSSDPLDILIDRLVKHGIAEDRWIAVIEQATTPFQRVTAWPVHDYLAAAAGTHYASPTLIIIGKVAALHADFQWLPDNATDAAYFPSLLKSTVIC
jgi:siroheme synthase